MRRPRGFSLAELLVVVVLFGILSSAILLSLFSAQRSWMAGSKQMVLTAELRKALDRVSRELVGSKASQVQRPAANGAWDQSVLFRVPQDRNNDGTVLDANGDIVEWSDWILVGVGPANTNSLVRTLNTPGVVPPPTETLANHITGVQFRRQNATADVVEIQLTASTITEGGEVMSRTMGTRVKLRN